MATNNISNSSSAPATGSNNNSAASRAPATSTATTATTTTTTTTTAPTKTATTTNASSSSSLLVASPLHVRFPVNAVMELTLAPTGEQVQGTVYTTDEISQSLVLQKSLVHTTLANEIRIIHVASITSSSIITNSHDNDDDNDDDNNNNDNNNNNNINSNNSSNDNVETTESKNGDAATISTTTNHTSSITNHSNSHTLPATTTATTALESLSSPLPTISRKTLEEREKRAIRLAEESLRHINQKASPEGQATFDRLLKACNEVVWSSGESIIVLGQIQVNPPYGPDQCLLLPEAVAHAGSQESLERVRKIVASVTSTTTTTTMSRSNSSTTS